uniref:Secreted protein n=1 Tax=Caenorhabditis tropicalis TaxID=1561998 RepID=A0A1I7SXW4_9PELO
MRNRKSWLTLVLCTVFHATWAFSNHNDLDERTKNSMMERSHCFSCASFVYLPLWSQLMHHYYPPKNFTDRCWQPDSGIGLVPCNSACFTLVERIDGEDCE